MKFGKEMERWANLGVIFSEKRLENICSFMVENNIPYRCRPVVNFGMNNNLSLANVPSAWHIYVLERDLYRVRKYAGTGGDL